MNQDIQKSKLNINAKTVAKYALLPGIFPNLRRIAQHVSQFMFMFTSIFGAVGLIDKNHPCLRPENIGHYRFTDIIGLAASNVIFDKKHLPQIIMFFVVIGSIILTIAIGLAFVATLLMNVNTAQAQLFGTPTDNGVGYATNKDWALLFLARIFGDVGGFFPKGAGGNMWFTGLLTGMLKHYSLAMLVVAAFMIMYLLVITLTESAKTGKPFGTRFDSIWAPVRMAMAIGLLIPVTSAGYNGAQMMTFQPAIWGSNLATNAWMAGLNSLGGGKKYFATSMTDEGYKFVRDMFLVNLCIEGLRTLDKKEYGTGVINFRKTDAKNSTVYNFGPKDSPDFCGQVTIMKPISDAAKPASYSGKYWPALTLNAYDNIARDFLPAVSGAKKGETVIPAIMKGFTDTLADKMMRQNQPDFTEAVKSISGSDLDAKIRDWVINHYWVYLGRGGQPGSRFFETGEFDRAIMDYSTWLETTLKKDAQYGWATAGVFYLRMSSAMSVISSVVNNPPKVTMLPSNLSKAYSTPDNPNANDEQIRDYCSGTWQGIKAFFGLQSETCEKYELSSKINTFLNAGQNWFVSSVKNNPDTYALFGGTDFDRAVEIPKPSSPTNASTALIIGPITSALYEFFHIESKNLNPMGSVISWGSLMLTISGLAYAIAIPAAIFSSALSSIASSIGNMFLVPGFVLAFLIPMLPFLHFTFAVIEWMISVLEAVIGMPLWALSLITLDGEGLGRLGTEGVKRLFEIILRPTIVILSLIASVIVFTAAVGFFNDAMAMFSSGYSDSSANDSWMKNALAGFGMVFMYVFGIYSLANSSFKLITALPDNFGRWGGLPKGFGSEIKTGIRDIEGALVGGMLFQGAQQLGGAAGSGIKSVKDDRKQTKQAKEQQAAMAKINQRLDNLEG